MPANAVRLNAGAVKTYRNEAIYLHGTVTIGASGAVSSQTAANKSCAVVTKTASKTGRYTITLTNKFAELIGASANLIIGDDAAATIADGNECTFRDNDIASDGTIEIQCHRSDTMADANPTSGTVIMWTLVVARRP